MEEWGGGRESRRKLLLVLSTTSCIELYIIGRMVNDMAEEEEEAREMERIFHDLKRCDSYWARKSKLVGTFKSWMMAYENGLSWFVSKRKCVFGIFFEFNQFIPN